MWVARNGKNASRCERDTAKRQECSNRKAVLLPPKHGAVFCLSRNGIRGGQSAMVSQGACRISEADQSQKTVVRSWVKREYRGKHRDAQLRGRCPLPRLPPRRGAPASSGDQMVELDFHIRRIVDEAKADFANFWRLFRRPRGRKLDKPVLGKLPDKQVITGQQLLTGRRLTPCLRIL